MTKEKRVYQRRDLRIPMLCWKSIDGKPGDSGLEIVSKDLSVSGLSFESKTIYPLGTILIAEIILPGRKNPLSAKLKVARIESILGKQKKFLIGVIFDEIKIEDRGVIAASVEKMNLYTILEESLKLGASDLHLAVGHPPIFRIQGKIYPLKAEAIKDGEIKAMLYPLLSTEQVEVFEKNKELDFAFSPSMSSRFRVNLHLQRGFLEAAIRSIPAKMRSFIELGLPMQSMEALCKQKSGLILIAGVTGSGKTTTVAAMADFINKTQEGVVITIENPIEYTIKSDKSIIKQRELGSDTLSYAEALKHTLRQDPNVVIVGELLDCECVLAAMHAAETGHLVISTVHASDTIHAIERIVNFFTPEHMSSIRQQLSSCLTAILFQVLLESARDKRVLATELLVNNTAIKNLIRDGRYEQIRTIIQTGRQQGMHTLQSKINELYEKSLISAGVMQKYTKGSGREPYSPK